MSQISTNVLLNPSTTTTELSLSSLGAAARPQGVQCQPECSRSQFLPTWWVERLPCWVSLPDPQSFYEAYSKLLQLVICEDHDAVRSSIKKLDWAASEPILQAALYLSLTVASVEQNYSTMAVFSSSQGYPNKKTFLTSLGAFGRLLSSLEGMLVLVNSPKLSRLMVENSQMLVAGEAVVAPAVAIMIRNIVQEINTARISGLAFSGLQDSGFLAEYDFEASISN